MNRNFSFYYFFFHVFNPENGRRRKKKRKTEGVQLKAWPGRSQQQPSNKTLRVRSPAALLVFGKHIKLVVDGKLGTVLNIYLAVFFLKH